MEALAVRQDLGSELSRPTGSRLELAELAVHALAQIPDAVRLELGRSENRRLWQIADAYGVRDRIGTRGDDALAFVTPNGVVSSAELAYMSLGEIVESVGEGVSSRPTKLAIARLAADPEQTHELGSRARRTIEARWSISHAAEAMLAGLRLGASVRSRAA